MLWTVSDQINIIFLCKWVSAYISCFSGIYGIIWIVNTNVNMETCTRPQTHFFKNTVNWLDRSVEWFFSLTQFGIMVKGKILSTWRTTCPNVTFSFTNPAYSGLGLNLGLCHIGLESNQLSDGMDIDLSGISIMDIDNNVVSQYWNVLPLITLPLLIWQNVAVENIESKNFSPLRQWWFYSSW